MTEQNQESFLPPSKRAARRILQRAFVLTGRDRALRQHIREARFTTVWILEDWDLVWTVIIDRGKIDFERRPARHPDLTLTWPTAVDFFSSASRLSPPRGRLREGISHGAGFQSEIPRCARNDQRKKSAPCGALELRMGVLGTSELLVTATVPFLRPASTGHTDLRAASSKQFARPVS